MVVGFGNMEVTSGLSENHFGGVLRPGEEGRPSGLESEMEMRKKWRQRNLYINFKNFVWEKKQILWELEGAVELRDVCLLGFNLNLKPGT